METGNVSGNKGQTNKKLSLEEYQIVVQSRSCRHLNVKHLTQILAMHGYAKPPHFKKKNLIDAVRSLDLVDLRRSTLGEDISPPLVPPSLDEVTADLAELGWLDDESPPNFIECLSSSSTVNGVVLETATGKKKKVQGPNSAAGQAGAKRQRKGKKNTSAASVGGSSESLKRTVRVPAISSKKHDNLPKEYSWTNCSTRQIKGSPYPKTYYTCRTVSGCPARIDVVRAPDDPAMLIVTYRGEHSHAPDNKSGGI